MMISFQQNLFEVRTTNIRENIWGGTGGGVYDLIYPPPGTEGDF